MKRNVIIGIVAMLCLVGCAATVKQPDVKRVQHDAQMISGYASIADGLLINTKDTLSFTEPESGTKKIVCGNAGCPHDNAKKCVAAKMAFFKNPIVYDNHIYAIDERGGVIYSCDIDGNNLKECENKHYSVGKVSPAVRVDDKLYFSMGEEQQGVDEEGYVYVTGTEGAFYQLDLKSGEVKTICMLEESFALNYSFCWYSNGEIFLSYNIQKKSLEEAGYTPKDYFLGVTTGDISAFLDETEKKLGVETHWIRYSVENDNAVVLTDSILDEGHLIPQAVSLGKWLYRDGTTIIQKDIDSGEVNRVELRSDMDEMIDLQMVSDGIIVTWKMSDNKRKYEYYKELAEKPLSWDDDYFSEHTLTILAEGDKKLYVMVGGLEDGEAELEYNVIDKFYK